jgi:hypothetical protein
MSIHVDGEVSGDLQALRVTISQSKTKHDKYKAIPVPGRGGP